uniref:Uncharacterized protein n=1 Tax=Oryza meridionalis TaxID=40149 RepID=A0A0E0F5G8_9ORYZ
MGVTPRERRRSAARFLDEERMEVRERGGELMSLSDASSHLGRCVLRPHPIKRRRNGAQTSSGSTLIIHRRSRRRGFNHVRGHHQKRMGNEEGRRGSKSVALTQVESGGVVLAVVFFPSRRVRLPSHEGRGFQPSNRTSCI